MIEISLYLNLSKICGKKNISNDIDQLKKYSSDLSFMEEKAPSCIVWPSNTKQVEQIVRLANNSEFSLIPVSSSSNQRFHGDTIPHKKNCVIIDLSRMSKIIEIDGKNRVIMVEPGVTFNQLIPELKKKGLRILTPLNPRGSKSVLTSALEREPITIPRYMWDSSDPLLCTEVVFGTGDIFRTGMAAGPGTIKQQKKAGQAQINPMGPTQFSPFRVIQGAQGSLGIVTWATIKLEINPTIQKAFIVQSENIKELMNFQHELIKYRLCDETFILNNLNFATLFNQNTKDIFDYSKQLDDWTLVYVIAGYGELATDKIDYLERDIEDIAKTRGINTSKNEKLVIEISLLDVLSQSREESWRLRFKGGCQDIFFLTSFEKIEELTSFVKEKVSNDLGIYIQPLNQGTSFYCEFDLLYDPEDINASKNIKNNFSTLSIELMDKGAFFNRPYGLWAKEVFKRHESSTQMALKKVKHIFDPNNVLNPGVLCFDD